MDYEETKKHFSKICERIWNIRGIEELSLFQKYRFFRKHVDELQSIAEYVWIAWNICINRSYEEARKKVFEYSEFHPDGQKYLLEAVEIKHGECWDDNTSIYCTTVRWCEDGFRAVAFFGDYTFLDDCDNNEADQEKNKHKTYLRSHRCFSTQYNPFCSECAHFCTDGLWDYCSLHEEEIFDEADSCSLWSPRGRASIPYYSMREMRVKHY